MRFSSRMAQMSSMLEHRADVIRKLKEDLRKMQQDDEQSCKISHF